MTLHVRHRPCPSCPYRQDVPSGLWAESEYDKLPGYDGSTTEQAAAGAMAAFHCHTDPDRLCAGWAGCHDMRECLGLRLEASVTGQAVGLEVYDYRSPVALFASGAEAAEHGKRDIASPGPRARCVSAVLARKIARRPDEDR